MFCVFSFVLVCSHLLIVSCSFVFDRLLFSAVAFIVSAVAIAVDNSQGGSAPLSLVAKPAVMITATRFL